MARKPASSRTTSSTVNTAWGHQLRTLSFLDPRPYALDNSDMGTGKTAAQIWAYQRRRARGVAKRWLIVCPKTLMVPAWGGDITRFAPELTVAFANAENRAEAFAMNTDVVVINTDGIKFFVEKDKIVHRELLRDFTDLTIDEYTAFKNPTSQRTKAMITLSKLFKHRYGMSGTPTPNSVTELWAPMMIIDGGARLGRSFSAMRKNVQIPEQTGPSANHIQWVDKPGIAAVVDKLLEDVVIRHEFEDVMKHVPPNHKHYVAFELDKKARAAYDKLENDLIIALEDATVSAVHAASLRTKLLQIASGAVYSTPNDLEGEGDYSVVSDARYEFIADLIEDTPHSVVFFNWRHQRDLLLKAFAKRKWPVAVIDGSVTKERDNVVARYQAGELKTILLHPRTGAHGLTLTRGTLTVWSSPRYEVDLMKQGDARIYRGGQTQVTNTMRIEAANTVERAVYERLNDKYQRMQDLLDFMKLRNQR